MSEIINLNKVRKRKAREKAEVVAAQNRVLFGRTKAEKQRDAAVSEDATRKLDGLRRESTPESDPEC